MTTIELWHELCATGGRHFVKPAIGGASEEEHAFPIAHRLAPGARATELKRVANPVLVEILKVHNGALLFDAHVEGEEPGVQGSAGGLRLLGADELQGESDRLQEVLRMGLAALDEDDQPLGPDGMPIRHWYRGFIPFARPEYSGDAYVLDTAMAREGKEPRVLRLHDDDFSIGALNEDIVEAWPSLDAFMEAFHASPAGFFAETWQVDVDARPCRLERMQLVTNAGGVRVVAMEWD